MRALETKTVTIERLDGERALMVRVLWRGGGYTEHDVPPFPAESGEPIATPAGLARPAAAHEPPPPPPEVKP